MQTSIQAINESVRAAAARVEPLKREIAHRIVGQNELIDRLLVALIAKRIVATRAVLT